jgi:WD40 repeat protein
MKQSLSRRRGAILTAVGDRKLQAARQAFEQQHNFGVRYTKEQLCELLGLSSKTITRIFGGGFAVASGKVPVDKQSLDLCFSAFNLILERQDYAYPDRETTAGTNDLAVLSDRHQRCDTNPAIDCGEAPDVTVFYGRDRELVELRGWVNADRCRLVCILGIGGIGKTAFVTKLARDIHPEFSAVAWRSLRNAPPLTNLLPKLIEIFSNRVEIVPPTMDISAQISCLLHYFREQRCLLILDNAETIVRAERDGKPEAVGYTELLQRIGDSEHQSCLLLTSREKPAAIVALEGANLPVRTLGLSGLRVEECGELFDTKGLSATSAGRSRLVANYSGNPLALNIVATTITDLFDGDIDAFLETEVTIFNDIRHLLDQQFALLSPLEQTVMYWLAIDREWVSVEDLHADILPVTSKADVLEAVESLSRKSLVEHRSGKFTQQAVVMEYLTVRSIAGVVAELTNWEPHARLHQLPLWLSYAFLKAQSPQYIHAIQTRLILEPIARQLLMQFGHKLALAKHLQTILASCQTNYRGISHYGGGNFINLFRYLQIDLTGYDFSNLPIWQADLQGAILHDVNFSGADFAKTRLTRTFGWVSTLAFSPDSQILATGEYRGDIHLWQVADKRLKYKLVGHTNWIWSIDFSPDGRLLASASQDATVRIWDAATGHSIHVLQADNYQISCLCFHPNGKLLATGHANGELRWWDAIAGELISTQAIHPKQIYSVKFSHDGRLFATGGDGNSVKIWDAIAISDGVMSLLHVLTTDTDCVRSLRFSPNGKLLAVGSNDGTIQLWDLATRTVVAVLPTYANWPLSIDFSPDGRLLAAGDRDYEIKIWDVFSTPTESSKRVPIATLRGHQSLAAALQFSPDGKLLATGSADRSIRLWDSDSWQEIYRWQGYNNWIPTVAFNPAGTQLVSGSQDGIVRLWDVSTGNLVQNLIEHQRGLFAVVYSPNGLKIASACGNGVINICEATTAELLQTIAAHTGAVWAIQYSPDSRLIASSGMDRRICLWSETGTLVSTIIGHPNLVKSLAFSPDGKLLATGSFDACWRLWDLATTEMLGCYPGHTNWIWDVKFSPNGQLIATASADRTAKLWDVSTGALLKTFTGHTDEVMTIGFSPDGRSIATGSIDRSIKLWDLETGELLQTLTGHLDRVLSLSYAPDGKLLATGSADETVKFWDASTGTCLRTCKPPAPYLGTNITGIAGLLPASIASLKTLGAIVTHSPPI